MSAYAEFLHGLLLAPGAVAAPTPSGPVLAKAIAGKLDPRQPGLVVELGPGTGVVTRAVLERGIHPDRIAAVECCGYFVGLLRSQFPGVSVHHGDAFRFEDYLTPAPQICAILSEIPLLNFSPVSRKALIQKSLRLCDHFIQLSYGWTPPVEAWAGVSIERTFVWRNLPPAHVWHYRRDGAR